MNIKYKYQYLKNLNKEEYLLQKKTIFLMDLFMILFLIGFTFLIYMIFKSSIPIIKRIDVKIFVLTLIACSYLYSVYKVLKLSIHNRELMFSPYNIRPEQVTEMENLIIVEKERKLLEKEFKNQNIEVTTKKRL